MKNLNSYSKFGFSSSVTKSALECTHKDVMRFIVMILKGQVIFSVRYQTPILFLNLLEGMTTIYA